LIVLLRIAIGWHFFYEGIHKFEPSADFSAKGFLGMAKGPAASLFYDMLPDLHGLQRLEIGTVKNTAGKEVKTFIVYENAWNDFYARFVKQHKLDEDQKKQIDTIFHRYLDSLRDGAADVAQDVAAYKASLDRFNTMRETIRNDAEFEQMRRWDAMMAYRREAEGWINMLNSMGNGLQSDMARVVSSQLAGDRGHIVTVPEKAIIPNPVASTQMRLLDLSVMVGLSAIGLCMILGFCNRLACLGGAAFLVNVILTTWPVPGVYPPLPTAVGNFLFVSKDGVELVAMLLLASLPAGRWGGLDYFLWHCGGKKIAAKFGLNDETV